MNVGIASPIDKEAEFSFCEVITMSHFVWVLADEWGTNVLLCVGVLVCWCVDVLMR